MTNEEVTQTKIVVPQTHLRDAFAEAAQGNDVTSCHTQRAMLKLCKTPGNYLELLDHLLVDREVHPVHILTEIRFYDEICRSHTKRVHVGRYRERKANARSKLGELVFMAPVLVSNEEGVA